MVRSGRRGLHYKPRECPARQPVGHECATKQSVSLAGLLEQDHQRPSAKRFTVSQRFTLDRQSFDQFIAAVSLFQPLQQASARKCAAQDAPLLLHLLEALRAIDARELDLQSALERVAALTLRVVGGDGAAVWLLADGRLACHAAAGTVFEDDRTRSAVLSKLLSAGAWEEDLPPEPELTGAPEEESGSRGSSLVTVLPDGKVAGALAAFSDQPGIFTGRDAANLRLLAGLAQYILTTSPEHVEIEDLYVPGVGTRAALGWDADGRPPIATVLRERTEELTAKTAGLGSSAVGIARREIVAGTQGLKRTASAIGPDPERPLQREEHPSTDGNTQPAVTSKLWLAAQSAVASLKSSIPSGPSIPVDDILRNLRRIRSTSRKLMRDVLPRAAARKQFSKKVSRVGSALGNQTRPVGIRLQAWSATGALEARRRMLRTKAAAGNTLRDIRNVGVNGLALRKAAPAVAILGVMFFFVVLQVAGRKPQVSRSLSVSAEAAARPVINTSANGLSRGATAVALPRKSAAVPTQSSHLQVTDRATEATIAELSRYEIRNLPRAANYGDDEAALQLGMLYEVGRGFPQSCRKAAEWVTKAAENGNAAAEYNLGLRYQVGDGVAANIQEAENWLHKAAAHKNSTPERALVVLPARHPESSEGKMAAASPLAVSAP